MLSLKSQTGNLEWVIKHKLRSFWKGYEYTNTKFYAIDIHLSSNVLNMTIIHASTFHLEIICECYVCHEKLIRLTHDIWIKQSGNHERKQKIRSVRCVLFSVKLNKMEYTQTESLQLFLGKCLKIKYKIINL